MLIRPRLGLVFFMMSSIEYTTTDEEVCAASDGRESWMVGADLDEPSSRYRMPRSPPVH
jgi:hypothetical protein